MINFIKPNQFAASMKYGSTLLGLECDFNAYTRDFMDIINPQCGVDKINSLYSKIIPNTIGVFTMSVEAGARLNAKYGFQAQELAAAIIPRIDSRYSVVMFIGEEYIEERSIILHELVHVEQTLSGKLTMGTDEITWLDNDVILRMKHSDNIARIQEANGDAEQLILHELSKPWELEAYSKTLTSDIVSNLPDSCFKLIQQYKEKNNIVVS